jgi:sensor c-di-GMP phosphodiesterase-like protein
MSLKWRRRVSIAALALLGMVLGAASGYWLGRVTLLRTANTGLSSYASDLMHHSEEYSQELSSIRKAFSPSPYPYCSAQEIAAMQAMTFRSLQVKEIGRVRNGKFYCSAFLGRVDPPLPMPPVTMTLPGDIHVYSDAVLTFAGQARGTIIEAGGVDVVLSPNAFDHWSRPHVRFMVVVINPATRQMARIAGEPLCPGFWRSGKSARPANSTARAAPRIPRCASSLRNPRGTFCRAAAPCWSNIPAWAA